MNRRKLNDALLELFSDSLCAAQFDWDIARAIDKAEEAIALLRAFQREEASLVAVEVKHVA